MSADRSQTGDAHHASDANLDDAWLIVHVAGALILRLSKGGSRGRPCSDRELGGQLFRCAMA